MNCQEPHSENTCRIEQTLSLLSAKWTLLILCDLSTGTKRFGELKRSLAGISPNTLSARLQDLEKAGVVFKEVFPEVPPRVEYSFTPKGESLRDVLLTLMEWVEENRSDENI